MFFRYINTKLWSKAGHFNKALSKGPKSSTWIWNFHSDAHDFDMQQSFRSVLTRKVFSSNVAHLSLVFFWISSMHFHGAYFSNYDIWLKDPLHYFPSAHFVQPIIGQDILNSDLHSDFQGIHITSGIFQLWSTNIRSDYIHPTQICHLCFTYRYNSHDLWILFSPTYLLVHTNTIQEIQVFIHSSFICLIWVEFYFLGRASNSHFVAS